MQEFKQGHFVMIFVVPVSKLRYYAYSNICHRLGHLALQMQGGSI